MVVRIRPIETYYNGILFRSRLEARWGVFFDTLAIEYEYEPDYDEVESGLRFVWYKPDFYLPAQGYYVEIKPREPKAREITKAAGWSKAYGDTIVLYELSPPPGKTESGWLFSVKAGDSIPTLYKNMWWVECRRCGRLALTWYGEPPDECWDVCYTLDEIETLCEWQVVFDQEEDGIFPYGNRTPRLLEAYKMALSFRFGGGEEEEFAKQERRRRERERRERTLAQALNTYATKKYGGDWYSFIDKCEVEQEFNEWLERKQARY